MTVKNFINRTFSPFPMANSIGIHRPFFLLDEAGDGGQGDGKSDADKKSDEDKSKQDDLNKQFADRAKRAEEAAIKKTLEALGVKDLDEAKALTESARKADEARKTDLEKAEAKRIEAEEKAKTAEANAQANLDAATKRVLDSEIKINAASPLMDKDSKKVLRPAFRKEALDDVLILISREAIEEDGEKFKNIDKALADLAKAKPYLLEEPAQPGRGTPSDNGRQFKNNGTQERTPIIRSL